MTSKDIINGFCEMVFRERSNNKVFPNIFLGRYEADILEITKSGYAYEYEVKISRSDFKADAKKSSGWIEPKEANFEKKVLYKHDLLKEGSRVSRFFFIVPKGLVSPEDVPDFAGLIYADAVDCGFYSREKGHYTKKRVLFTIVKEAPRLSKEKFSQSSLIKCLESTYYRFHRLRRDSGIKATT